MPVRYIIHKQKRLVITTGWDRITFDEAKAHQDQLLNDPDFDPEFNQLLDGTAATDYALAGDQIRLIVSRRVFSPTSRRALVVSSNYAYGIARMLATYYEMSEVASPMSIFHDRDSALKWLGIRESHETRRSTRVPIKIRVETSGISEPLTCEGETVVVSNHGALISTTLALHLGMRIEIHVVLTDKRAPAQVVYLNPDSPQYSGIALERPANIWGIDFPPSDWKDDSVVTTP